MSRKEPPTKATYCIHWPGWHCDPAGLVPCEVDHTYDEVEASSAKAAAVAWVARHHDEFDWLLEVEGIFVTGPDGAITTWDVRLVEVPVFRARRAGEVTT